MTIFVYLFIISLFIIIKKIFDIPFKIFTPVFLVIIFVSISFNKASMDTKYLNIEDNIIPFGVTYEDAGVIKINEAGIAMESIFTTINYDIEEYEKQFEVPTLDILVNDKISLNIVIGKGFTGDYKIFLPTNENKNIFYISKFESFDKKTLKLENKLNRPTNEIIIHNRLKVPLEADEGFTLTLGIIKENLTYNEKAITGINFFNDDNFKIKFNNGKSEDEFLKIIINEDFVDETKFFSKIVTTHSLIGLKGFTGHLQVYDDENLQYKNIEILVYDEEDTYQGGLKPSLNNLQCNYYNVDNKRAVYTLLDTKKAYCLKTNINENSIFKDASSPYMYFITLKSGGIIKQKNKNVTTVNNNYNFILKTSPIMQISLEGFENYGSMEFELYRKNLDGTAGELIENCIVSEKGFLVNKKNNLHGDIVRVSNKKNNDEVINPYKINNSSDNINIEHEDENHKSSSKTMNEYGKKIDKENLLYVPYSEKNNLSNFLLIEKNNANPLIIEILDTNFNGIYTSFYINNNKNITHSLKKEELFYNKINNVSNFITLYNLNIKRND